MHVELVKIKLGLIRLEMVERAVDHIRYTTRLPLLAFFYFCLTDTHLLNSVELWASNCRSSSSMNDYNLQLQIFYIS
jgi:hypothetical protein